MDRRARPDRRSGEDRRAGRKDVGADADRRATSDRRQVERRQGSRPARNINQYDMSKDVLEFVNAVNSHRESSGNRFPSAGDILQILKDLGYEKRA
jgi:hypothetical protein